MTLTTADLVDLLLIGAFVALFLASCVAQLVLSRGRR